MFSISFKDGFNYPIFKHAETIQIGERETGVRSIHSLVKSGRSPGPIPSSEAHSKLVQDPEHSRQEGQAKSAHTSVQGQGS